MWGKNLITQTVKESEKFDGIMKGFKSGLGYGDLSDLQSKCFVFLEILKDLGGPPSQAANALELEWKDEVEKLFPRLAFINRSRNNRSISTPGNVVGIRPTINRKAYSEDHAHNKTSMEQYHSFGQNDTVEDVVQDSSIITTKDADTSIYFRAEEDGGCNDHSEFTHSTRPSTLNGDPRNPMILGKDSTNDAIKPPVYSVPAMGDSGLPPLSRTNSVDGSVSSSSQRNSNCDDMTKPSQAMSDQSDKKGPFCISCSQRRSLPGETNMVDYIDNLRSQQEKERQEADKRYMDLLKQEHDGLKEELRDLRKESKMLFSELGGKNEELKSLEKKLHSAETELSKKIEDLRLLENTLANCQKELKREKMHESIKEVENEYIKREKKELYRMRKELNELRHDKQTELRDELKRLKQEREAESDKLHQLELKEQGIEKEREKLETNTAKFRKTQEDFKEQENALEIKQQQVLQQERQVHRKSQLVDKKERQVKEKEDELDKRDDSLRLREQRVAEEQRQVEEEHEQNQQMAEDYRRKESCLQQEQKIVSDTKKKQQNRQYQLKCGLFFLVVGYLFLPIFFLLIFYYRYTLNYA